MKLYRFCFVVISTLAPFNSSFADIEWATRDKDVAAGKGSAFYKTEFKFVNKNADPVKIKATKSSCGCTVSKVIYNEVAPGNEGVIEVTFNFGHRQGRHTKQIIVETDDKDMPVSQLTLTVDIPTVFHSKPAQIIWTVASPASAIPLTVSTDADAGLKFQGVRVTDSIFRSEIVSLNKDGNVDLSLSSVDLSLPKMGSLIIDYLDVNGLKRSFTVPLIISDSETTVSPVTELRSGNPGGN